MSDPVLLTIVVLGVCPLLILIIGRLIEPFGCCVLWLVLFVAWCAQALAWVVGGPT